MTIKVALEQAEYKGMLRIIGDKIFRRVKNGEAATALVYGGICAYNGADGETVTEPATALFERMAGVVCDADKPANTAYTIAAGAYGWIQVAGTGTAYHLGQTTEAVAAGDSIMCVNGEVHGEKDAGAGTVQSYNHYLTALEASDTATAALIDVAIHCL